MNQFFIQPVIQDREKEVASFAKYNQIERDSRDSSGNQPESTEREKIEVIFWLLEVTKRLKGILTIKTDGSVKA